ncbi:MAG: ABC transporter permease [Clostridiales bacterium]|nr:ABC transporter permease [Clostridiales bacterium]
MKGRKMNNSTALRGSFQRNFSEFNRNYFITYVIIGTAVIFAIASPNFMTLPNMITILKQSSILAVVAAGQFFVLIGGDFDLSVGSVTSLSGVTFAGLIVFFGFDPLAAFGCGLLVGLGIGLINGLLVTRVGLPAFIGTMATMMSCSGASYLITKAAPVTNLPESIGWIGRGAIGDVRRGGVPYLVIIMIIVFVVIFIVTEKMNFGRNIYAMGGNHEAAYLSGINIRKFKIVTFMLSSGISSIAAVMLVSKLNAGDPNAGSDYAFESITAAVIGGTAITGGKGRIFGVMLGGIFLAMLFNGMTINNVNTFVQQIMKGAALAAAVGIDVAKNRQNYSR